ncbi:hypothetical protein [Pseudorhodoplanes sp.]|uniref:hypothetical protein n=1 Tax=Pseudorhodoplanes sp. TaxID=1934341 RepID=UPI002C10CC4F|nr:hypothetical protein [Pseudorhodoplanes sp.]HWV52424.1 hypothetical protein [Pseudorhodoplanes sp.]
MRALHEAQPGILSTNLYGPDGQGQFGADHIAFRTEGVHSLEVGQSKAHRTFGPSDLRNAADAFLENWDDHWHAKDVKRFILFVGCVIKSRQAADEIITLTRRFATDTLPSLTSLRSDLEPIQPERIEATRRVLHAHDDGEIVDQSEVSQVDTFTVRWDVKGGECGALRALIRRFTVTITREDVEQMRAAVAEAEAQVQLVDSLTGLIQQLSTGLDENIYQAVPVQRDGPQDPLRRASLQLMSALAKNGNGILWVDDRFLSSIEHDQFRVETTVEIIDAMVRYGRLTKSAAYGYRQKLRRARWMFMPIDGEEIAYFLRLAVKDAVLTESEDLVTLRRAVADMLLERRNLQWPTPHEAEQGARGEVPFLLDAGHAVTGALKAIWGSREWTVADAEVASAWLLEYLEIDLFPMPPLEADDPRSDHLIGIQLASLLLTQSRGSADRA